MQNSVWHTVNSINVNRHFMTFVVVNKIRRYTLKNKADHLGLNFLLHSHGILNMVF